MSMKYSKRILALMASMAMMISLSGGSFPTEYCVMALSEETIDNEIWDGTIDISWYVADNTELYINNASQLAGLRTLVNSGQTMEGKTIILNSDIYLNALDTYEEWLNKSPNCWGGIGSDSFPFKGHFDGKGHSVYGLYSTFSGLFYSAENANIENVNLYKSLLNIQRNTDVLKSVGIIANQAIGGTINNCNVSGEILGNSLNLGYTAVGGICGLLKYGSIASCDNYCDISLIGSCYSGGVVGSAMSITNSNNNSLNYRIIKCSNYGEVYIDGKNSCAGGIVGNSSYYVSTPVNNIISQCGNFGKIYSYNSGGILGQYIFSKYDNYARTRNIRISNCFNIGEIIGINAGGVLGYSDPASSMVIPYISNSYNIGMVYGSLKGGPLVGYERMITSVTNCFYYSSELSDNRGMLVTRNQFSSGEVAYLLNANNLNNCWYQKIGDDQYPVLKETDDNQVYLCKNCIGENLYCNQQKDNQHSYDENGFCIFCNEVVCADGHSYLITSWTWNEDHTSCTANLKCDRCGDESTVAITDIIHDHADPTSTQEGYERYTASVEIDGQTYSDTAVVTIPAVNANDLNEQEYNAFDAGNARSISEAVLEAVAAEGRSDYFTTNPWHSGGGQVEDNHGYVYVDKSEVRVSSYRIAELLEEKGFIASASSYSRRSSAVVNDDGVEIACEYVYRKPVSSSLLCKSNDTWYRYQINVCYREDTIWFTYSAISKDGETKNDTNMSNSDNTIDRDASQKFAEAVGMGEADLYTSLGPVSSSDDIQNENTEYVYSVSLTDETYDVNSLKPLSYYKANQLYKCDVPTDEVSSGAVDANLVAEVKVKIERNVGFYAAQLRVDYDDELIFIGCKKYQKESVTSVSNIDSIPNNSVSVAPFYNKVMIMLKENSNITDTGEFLTLLFALPKNPETNKAYRVGFTSKSKFVPWSEGTVSTTQCIDGSITISDYTYSQNNGNSSSELIDLDEQEYNAFDAENARSISEAILEAISTEEKPETYAMSPWRGGTTFVADDHGYVYADQNEVRVSSYRIAELLEEQGFITSASQFTQGHRSPLVEDGMEVAAEYIYRRPVCSSLLCKSKENWYRYQVNICYRDGAIKLTYSAASKDGEIRNDTNMSSLDNTIDRGASQKFAEAVGIGEADFYTSLGPVFECDATDHEYTPVWSWSDDFDSCTAVLECKNCEVKTAVIAATISKIDDESYAAACETTGQNTYIAEVIYNDQTYTDTKVQSVPALGHLNTVTSWAWNDDHTSCTANLKCSRCEEESTVVITDITHEHADPTAEQDGFDKYTASLQIDGQTYSDTAEIPISADEIKAVNAMILNTIKGNIQGEIGDAIEETRAAYNALPDEQKECIDENNYSIFVVIEQLYQDNKKIKSDSDEAIQNISKELEDALKAADEAKQKAVDAQNAKTQAETELQNVRQDLEQAAADKADAESKLSQALADKNAAVAEAEQALKDKNTAEEKASQAEKAKAEAEEIARLAQAEKEAAEMNADQATVGKEAAEVKAAKALADKEAAEKYAEEQRIAAESAQAKYEEQKALANKATEDAAEAEKALADANNVIEKLESDLENVNAALETAVNERNEAKSALDEVEKMISKLIEEKKNAEESASQAAAAKAEAEAKAAKALEEKNAAVAEAEQALRDKNTAEEKALQAENSKEEAEKIARLAQAEKEAAEMNAEQANAEKDKAEAKAAKALADKESAEKIAEEQRTAAESALAKYEEQKALADKAVGEAAEAEKALANAYNAIEELKRALEDVNAELETVIKESEEAKSAFDEAEKTIGKLTEEKKNAEESASQAADKFDDLSKQNDKLREKIASLTEDNQSLQAVNEQLTADNESLKSEKEQLTADNEALQTEKEQLAAENKTLQTEKEQLTADNETLQSEKEQLTADNEALQTEKEQLAAENKTLQTEKEQLAAENKTLQTEKEQLTAGNEALQSEKEQLVSDNERLQNETDKLTADNEALRAEIERLNAEIEALKAEIAELRAEIDALKAEIAGLNAEIEALRAENASLRAENEVLKAENEEIFMSDKAVEAALKEARNDLDKANKELDKAEKEKAKAEEKLRKAEQNHSDSEDKLNKARADLEEAEARLINATAGKEAAEARISELLDIIEKQDSTARQALADKKAAEARARQAEADLAYAEARASQAEADKAAAEAMAEQAKTDKLTAEESANQAEAERANAEARAEKAEAEKATAEAIAGKVLEEKAASEAVLDQIRAEIKSAEEVLDELKSENESLAEENAALKAEAAEVSELIAEIGNVELTEKCRDSILAARTAYEKLTYGQKTLVLNSVDLVVAEKTYESLELSADDVIEENETSEPEADTETDIPQTEDDEHSEPEISDNITVSEPENPSDDVPEEIISEQNNEDENETPQISEASLSEVDVEKFIEEILPQTGVTGSRSMYVFALIMIVAGAYMIRKSKKEV